MVLSADANERRKKAKSYFFLVVLINMYMSTITYLCIFPFSFPSRLSFDDGINLLQEIHILCQSRLSGYKLCPYSEEASVLVYKINCSPNIQPSAKKNPL